MWFQRTRQTLFANRGVIVSTPVLLLAFIFCEKTAVDPAEENVLEIIITSPSSGQVVNNPITIEAEVRHTRSISFVDFHIDSLIIGRDSISPYNSFWNAGFFADGGKHDLIAKVRDERGEIAESPKISVIVDTTASALRIVFPFEGSIVSGPITIMLDTTQLTSIQEVTYLVDEQILEINNKGPFKQDWIVGFWADGQAHKLKALAIDSSGRTGKSQVVSVTIPTSAAIWPEIFGPTSNDFIDSALVTFIWKSIRTAVSYSVETSEFLGSIESSHTTSDTSLDWNVPRPSLFTWRVKAYNKLGRSTSWSPFAEFATAITFSQVFPIQGGGGLVLSAEEVPSGEYIFAAQAIYQASMGTKIVRLNKKREIIWEKDRSMIAARIKSTSDGGYLVVGHEGSYPVGAILKLNSDGSELWSKVYSPYSREGFNDVSLNADGSFYLGGFIIPTLYPPTMADPMNGWLFKGTSDGDSIWTRIYRRNGQFVIQNLQTLDDGSLALAGIAAEKIDSFSFKPSIAWLSKVNEGGDTLWYREYQYYLHSMSISPNNGFILGGNTISSGEMWIAKVDQNGGLVWSNVVARPGYHYAADLIPVVGGGYVATGGYHAPGSSETVSLISIDENGTERWFKQYGASAYPRSITQTSDGGFLIGATIIANYGNQPWLLKTDKHGRIKFTD